MILATSLFTVFKDDKNKNKKVKILYYFHPSFFFQLRCVQIITKINSKDFLFKTEKEEFFRYDDSPCSSRDKEKVEFPIH
jgi:hypothetical protein